MDSGSENSTAYVGLRTPRLTLRACRPEDRRSFAAMNRDPRVMAHFPGLMDGSCRPRRTPATEGAY